MAFDLYTFLTDVGVIPTSIEFAAIIQFSLPIVAGTSSIHLPQDVTFSK